MKILYHHRTLGDGAEGIHIREMVKAFRHLGHEVLVAGPVGELSQSHNEQRGFLTKIKQLLPGFVFELLEVGYSFLCFYDLYRKVRVFCPDFIYDRYITFNIGTLWASRYCKIPLVLEVNAPLAHERSNQPDEKLYLKGLAHAIESYVCKNAAKTVVVSTPLKKYLESIGVPAGQCIVMPNGVDQIKFEPMPKKQNLMQQFGIPDHSVIIGFSGILRPWHGVEMLIEAVGELKKNGKQVYLLIVGDGPVREKLEILLKEANLAGCSIITGRLTHEQVAEYVNLMDIAVSPKATFYASPMKVVEYMALGKAVVTPNTDNFRDLVDDGINGIHFNVDSTLSLQNCLSTLCEDSQLRDTIGKNAREKVEQRLNWDWNAKEVSSWFLKNN